MRFRCADCGYRFDVNYSSGSGRGKGDDVYIPPYAQTLDGKSVVLDGKPGNPGPIYCPNCGAAIKTTDARDPDNDATAPPVHYGDRILVLKYLYLFGGPRRWDVVVFKSPLDNANTPPRYAENYIKRLVGRPGETIMILDGDIYVQHAPDGLFEIQRKPRKVQEDLWRVIYDNDFIPQASGRGGDGPWFAGPGSGWSLQSSDGSPSRVFGFRNADGPGELGFNFDAFADTHHGTDWLAYDQPGEASRPLRQVSDLKLECFYQRTKGEGPLRMSMTKGDDEFTAEVTPGHVRLVRSVNGGAPVELHAADVPALSTGSPARLELINCDYRVSLYVNGVEAVATTDAEYAPDVQRLLNEYKRDEQHRPKGARDRGTTGSDGVTPVVVAGHLLHQPQLHQREQPLLGNAGQGHPSCG